MKDHLEKAIASFNKEVRHNQHKVHLLCLVARGLYLSRQCDDIIRQGLLLSLLGADSKQLVFTDVDEYSHETISKILKWVSSRTTTLHQALRETVSQCEEDYRFINEQLLVTLLRALGLRVRLVIVLNPVSFKESRSTSKRKSVDVGDDTSPKKSADGEGEEKRENLRLKSECKSVSSPTSDASEVSGKKEKRSRRTSNEGSSSSSSSACSQTQKKARKRSPAVITRQGNTTAKKSPYFKKQTGRRGSKTSKQSAISVKEREGEEASLDLEQSKKNESSDSDSEYLPEEERSQTTPKKRRLIGSTSRDFADSDDDFVPPKKKRRKTSLKSTGASPAKKLKRALDESDKKLSPEVVPKTAKGTLKGVQSRKTSGPGDGDLCRSRGSSSESVEVVRSEETACWAEVYLPAEEDRGSGMEKRRKWSCVHLPSCSVNQPHLCEKHCTLALNYVIAIENGTFSVTL